MTGPVVERTLVEIEDHTFVSSLPATLAHEMYPERMGYRVSRVCGYDTPDGFRVIRVLAGG